MNDTTDVIWDMALDYIPTKQRRKFCRLVAPGLRRILHDHNREPTLAEQRILSEAEQQPTWWERLFT